MKKRKRKGKDILKWFLIIKTEERCNVTPVSKKMKVEPVMFPPELIKDTPAHPSLIVIFEKVI